MCAWTAPRTWVVGETLTAALLNTHLRDNLLDVDSRLDTIEANSPGMILLDSGSGSGTTVTISDLDGTYEVMHLTILIGSLQSVVSPFLRFNGVSSGSYRSETLKIGYDAVASDEATSGDQIVMATEVDANGNGVVDAWIFAVESTSDRVYCHGTLHIPNTGANVIHAWRFAGSLSNAASVTSITADWEDSSAYSYVLQGAAS